MRADHGKDSLELVQLALYIVNAIVGGILTYILITRPDDFFKLNNVYVSFNKLPADFRSDSVVLEIDSSKFLNVDICDFKTKLGLEQVPVVYYNITVKTSTSIHTVKRTYADFLELNNSLTKVFHWVSLPDLPKFDSARDPITYRMKELTNYLDAVCLPEVICVELLDFLGLDEPQRSQLSDLCKQLLSRRASITRVNEIIDCTETPTNDSCADISSLFKILIDQWEDFDSHVKYTITWVAPGFNTSGVVKYRYNDLHNMHHALKSLLHPGKLPHFPPKNIFALVDNSIYQRALELQTYLSTVANDPAYLCREFLDFLGCELPVDALLRRLTYNKVRLVEMMWESIEAEDNEIHILYVIKLERGDGDAVWTIRRRFSEFYKLSRSLTNRNSSPLLLKFIERRSQDRTFIPVLPRKTVKRLTDTDDIERRKRGLESYLEQCLQISHIRFSYAFKEFLNEPPENLHRRLSLV
eukprot:CAMPEP_0204900454 /NCGR_PEP_ID=MMETSP1397-20131031/2481_1 /ASSEMBLY_ACC=CAM_ASM_000891 /TAXON_ID=49980 /ORGANISM="Climacostomum Climacostomum virens, Strain Stock W-24" /LENGTH=469 /DNA_ID=CAMNT_0052068605 /DNA_START=396 /DNA_END=1805 /DNA_ORIENTATION=+